MKVLIIQTASIGDVILVTPMLEALHDRYPQASVDILVKEGMQQLFEGHPFLNGIITWNKKKGKYRNLFSTIGRVRHKKYDHVIAVQRYFSGGIITVLSGASVTTGFNKNPLSFLFTNRIEHKTGDITIHEAGRNLLLLKHLGIQGSWMPKLYPPGKVAERVTSIARMPWICIAPASLWFTKQWPEELWIDFLDLVPENYTCYIIGGRDDIPLAERICAGTKNGKVKNLAGELSFLETASLMEGASMNFTNDSAPLHLASAMNAPVTAIYCSTVPEFGFGPLSSESFIVQAEIPLKCRPCGIHGLKSCPESHFNCAYYIKPSELLSKIPECNYV